ncbi:hypothetical protein U9M48_014404 [Paspalum notatum var. saurae]|uniref:Uncharacterized protein n=1 Tax=Paspalum notatum var. saurae TaxID=547442 RepID=A0AAQ3WKF7_PASNO
MGDGDRVPDHPSTPSCAQPQKRVCAEENDGRQFLHARWLLRASSSPSPPPHPPPRPRHRRLLSLIVCRRRALLRASASPSPPLRPPPGPHPTTGASSTSSRRLLSLLLPPAAPAPSRSASFPSTRRLLSLLLSPAAPAPPSRSASSAADKSVVRRLLAAKVARAVATGVAGAPDGLLASTALSSSPIDDTKQTTKKGHLQEVTSIFTMLSIQFSKRGCFGVGEAMH